MRHNTMIHHLVINSADWFHLLSVCTFASIRGSRANRTGDVISGRVWQARVQMSVVFIFYFTLQLLVQFFWAAHIITGSSAVYTNVLFPCWPLFTGSLLSSEQISRCCTIFTLQTEWSSEWTKGQQEESWWVFFFFNSMLRHYEAVSWHQADMLNCCWAARLQLCVVLRWFALFMFLPCCVCTLVWSLARLLSLLLVPPCLLWRLLWVSLEPLPLPTYGD